MKKYWAELLGTYMLVFVGAGAIVIDSVTGGGVSHLGIGLTFGLVVMAMIYTIGDISGAHINPAVTIAFAVAKRFPKSEVFPYISFQVIGAILASATLYFLFPGAVNMGQTLPLNDNWLQSFVLELILTFILMFVILNVSTGAKEKGITAALAIGGVVAFEATFAGPICGASMNPARSIGPALFSGDLTHLWLYVVATTLGAILAVYSCRLIQDEDCCDNC
ncbi:MAG: aquaporin [Flavobacteriales bacterium]|jgi:aquaporin NIP|nr:aquaporin [Flavobacteriales bacterium]